MNVRNRLVGPSRWSVSSYAPVLSLALALGSAACGPRPTDNGPGGGTSSGGQGSAWVPYSNTEHGFVVDAPAPMVRTEEAGVAGAPPTVAYQLEVDPNFALRVQVNDFGAALANVQPEQIFDGGVRGAVNSTGATLRTQSPRPLGSVPGRAFIADNPARNYVVYGRMLLVGTRMYTLLAVVGTSQEARRHDAVERFMGSFRLASR